MTLSSVTPSSEHQSTRDSAWSRQASLPGLPSQPGRRVVDLGGYIPEAQEQELERAIDLLERDTPYRFRIFTPPAGYGPEEKAQWPSVTRAVGRYFALEPQWDLTNAVLLVVCPRVAKGRATNPLTFSVAGKLTEKLQYRIASDTFTKISNRFGDVELVQQLGEGEVASKAALNAIACLRKGVCMQPLPEDEARKIALAGSSVAVTTQEALAAAGVTR